MFEAHFMNNLAFEVPTLQNSQTLKQLVGFCLFCRIGALRTKGLPQIYTNFENLGLLIMISPTCNDLFGHVLSF